MFTLEIAGRPIAVIDAPLEKAEDSFHEEKFLSRLKTLKTGEGPLWDGHANLVVRPATDDEISALDEADESLHPKSDGSDEDEDNEAAGEEDEPLVLLLVATSNDR
jgi:hypothetical protein